MTRSFDAEFVTRHLVGLASLEAAIVFAARALVNSFPAVSNVERPGESPEIATARDTRIRSTVPAGSFTSAPAVETIDPPLSTITPDNRRCPVPGTRVIAAPIIASAPRRVASVVGASPLKT